MASEEECTACASSLRQLHSGAYRLHCLDCCARLVLSTRPSREHAAGMLEAIRRFLAQNAGITWTTADVAARARQMAGVHSEARSDAADGRADDGPR